MPSVDDMRHLCKLQLACKLTINTLQPHANFLVERNVPNFGYPLNGRLTFPLPNGIAVIDRCAKVKVELFYIV